MSWIRSDRYRSTFVRLLSPSPNERILDIGAGKGAVAALVRRTGSGEVHALDPNGKRVEFMRKRYPDLKTCISGSDPIPYPDAFFDKVYSTMAVHHFPDQRRSFAEMARVLKPGGLLVVVDFSPRTLLGRVNRLWENGVMRSHLTFLDLEELTALLRRDGAFEIAETRTDGPGYFVQAVRAKTAEERPSA